MMSEKQRSAAILALASQLEAMALAVDAARTSIALLTMDAEDVFEEAEREPVASTDPVLCEHPLIIKAGDQRLCDSCGTNLDAQ